MTAVFIKLGGSLITDKTRPYTLRRQALKRVAHEIAELRRSEPGTVWFIGNGAGSFGHYAVHQVDWAAQPDDPTRIAAVRKATGQLNQHVIEAMIEAGIPAITLPAAAFAHNDGSASVSDSEAIMRYAEMGAVPVVYGDVIQHASKGSSIMPTEEILETLASAWIMRGHTIATVIYATSVDGVLDEHGQAYEQLRADNSHAKFYGTRGYDISGGMAQKVNAGFQALETCSHVYILNGLKPGHISQAAQHQAVGTRLVPE